ncbi:Protein of unknown function [Gryllus bimaculatus]|nr:Protein of unknown function [Gryllus bimaculatus]
MKIHSSFCAGAGRGLGCLYIAPLLWKARRRAGGARADARSNGRARREAIIDLGEPWWENAERPDHTSPRQSLLAGAQQAQHERNKGRAIIEAAPDAATSCWAAEGRNVDRTGARFCCARARNGNSGKAAAGWVTNALPTRSATPSLPRPPRKSGEDAPPISIDLESDTGPHAGFEPATSFCRRCRINCWQRRRAMRRVGAVIGSNAGHALHIALGHCARHARDTLY